MRSFRAKWEKNGLGHWPVDVRTAAWWQSVPVLPRVCFRPHPCLCSCFPHERGWPSASDPQPLFAIACSLCRRLRSTSAPNVLDVLGEHLVGCSCSVKVFDHPNLQFFCRLRSREFVLCCCRVALSFPKAFEVVLGCNGYVWVHSNSPRHTIVVSNAILNSEHLAHEQVCCCVTIDCTRTRCCDRLRRFSAIARFAHIGHNDGQYVS